MNRSYTFSLMIVLFLCLLGIVDALATTITITPSFNKNFLPEGPNPNNLNHNKVFTLTVAVNGIPVNEYCKIEVKLIDVTKWKGYCANYPQTGANTQRDLKFLRSDYINSSGQKIAGWNYHGETDLSYKTTTGTPEPSVTKTVKVRSYDYGAYAKLEVTVRQRGSFFYGTVIAGPTTQTIPIDTNGNRIADGWENDAVKVHVINGQAKAGYNPAADNEQVLNNNDGDAWSVYEEYRGLWTGTQHIRLNPTKKEALVCPENDWHYGKGTAGKIPSHTFHTIHQDYVKRAFDNIYNNDGSMKGNVDDDIGWVNVNSASIPGSIRTYAIRIDKSGVSPDEDNLAERDRKIFGEAPLGPPSQKSRCRIFYTTIRRFVNWKVGSEDASVIDPLVNKVIAHEIGHCVHLWHCSVPWASTNNCIMQRPSSNPRDVKTAFAGHSDGSHESDYALTGSPGNPKVPDGTQASNEMFFSQITNNGGSPAPGTTTQPPATSTTQTTTPSTTSVTSTNTGSSSYGCDYNAEYDYCTDTGTCTTRTDATGIGMCGHRWCCCAPDTTTQTPAPSTPTPTPSTSVTSTNTGSSSYGCDYNAEYDYCTDTGTCSERSGEFGIGVCGHRWCCCAPE